MHAYATEMGWSAVTVSLLDWKAEAESYDDFFRRSIQCDWQQLLRTRSAVNSSKRPRLVIIDEFQDMFQVPDWHHIWALLNMHLTCTNRAAHDVYPLLVAAYTRTEESRRPLSRYEAEPLDAIPWLHLQPQCEGPFMQFTAEELHAVVQRYQERAVEALTVPFDETLTGCYTRSPQGMWGSPWRSCFTSCADSGTADEPFPSPLRRWAASCMDATGLRSWPARVERWRSWWCRGPPCSWRLCTRL